MSRRGTRIGWEDGEIGRKKERGREVSQKCLGRKKQKE
jgi:hypothetical protein